jgi:hypothetical protein
MEEDIPVGTRVVRTSNGKVQRWTEGDTGKVYVVAEVHHINGPYPDSKPAFAYYCVPEEDWVFPTVPIQEEYVDFELFMPVTQADVRGFSHVEL